MVRHAFLMNCHRDVDAALLSTALYRRYWSNSALYLYLDGPEYSSEQLAHLEQHSTRLVRAPVEPAKTASILNALNALVEMAQGDGVEVGSFVHADMIPMHALTFRTFVERFAGSDAACTFTPVNPGTPFIEFCNLHFHLPRVVAQRLFPVRADATLPAELQGCNEAHVSRAFDAAQPGWRERAYPMWMLSLPLWRNEAISYQGNFFFHNCVPESSVVHTNDPEFWAHYAEIAQFAPRPYPVGVI